MKLRNTSKAFTLIELLVVMGIFSVLAGLATVNLIKPQTQATFSSAVNVLAADIKGQQLKAISGDTSGEATSQAHGIYFESDKYTLFRGSGYVPANPGNFVVDIESGNSLTSITFPTQQVVFAKRSGEVTSYVSGSDSLIIQSTQSGEQKTITINRYGAISVN